MMKLRNHIVLLLLIIAVLGTQVSFASPDHNGFIQQVSPAWGTTDVNPYVSISVTTDTEISGSDLSKYVKLIDENGRKVSGVRVVKGSGTTFYADADYPLKPGKTYRLVYMDSIPLTSFTTATKQLVSTAGFKRKYGIKRDIALDKTFEIGFTKAMEETSLDQGSIWIENDLGEKVDATLTLASDKRSATIDPKENFAPGRMYFLKISGDAKSVSQIGLGTPIIQPFRTRHE